MELATHKCVVLVVLVCVRLTLGLCPLPILSGHDDGVPQWAQLTLALSFSLAGGVLIATVFLHMMPEVRLLMDHFLPDHHLPVTELLVTAGFLLTFLLDEVIINIRSSYKVNPAKDGEPGSEVCSEGSRPSTAGVFRPLPRGALMSLHGLGQGMAVGLADSVASTWLMAAAAGVAGSADSAASTARLLACRQSSKVVVLFCLVVTAAMASGVMVGALLWHWQVEGAVLTVLRALAAGNLLYQAVYELLTRDVRERAMGLLSLFVCLMGFLVILFLQVLDIKSFKHHYSNTDLSTPSTQDPEEEPDYENAYSDNNEN